MKKIEKNIKKALFALIVSFLFPLASFAQFDFNEINANDINNIDFPKINIPAPKAEPIVAEIADKSVIKATVKDWTIMTFVNAKNNLEGFGLGDINEMEEVGSTSRINIIAEIGRMKGHSSSDGNWTGTRRLYIKKDNNTSKISSPIVKDLGKTNMGDWKELVKFVTWAKKNYPAKHYALIVWNYGSGWLEGNPVKEISKGISYDDETGNNIDTPQLAKALSQMGKIDIYASDACLMQMASVVYEIGTSVDYIIGSEETEPGRGYTYDKFLGALKSKPTMSSFELSKKIISAYVSFFSGNTQSVVNTKWTKYLPHFTNKFVDAVMKANIKTEVRTARDEAQKYSIEDNKDMYDFVRRVVGSTSNRSVKGTGDMLMRFLEKYLIAYNDRGIMTTKSHGLAVYLPSGYYQGYTYDKLKWTTDSKWDEFIKWSK